MNPGPKVNRTHTTEIYERRLMAPIAARWDAKAKQWDADLRDPLCHLNEDKAYERFMGTAHEIIQSRHEFCAAQGIIDAGCATGLVLAAVIGSFAWGIGVDISPSMIRQAQAKGIPRATFILGDCFNLSATGPKAGAVLSRGILLSHYGRPNALALLQSARSSLVPGGFVLWDYLNEVGRDRFEHAPMNKTYFRSEEVCEMALEAGFHRANTLSKPDRRVGLLLAEIS